MLGRVDPQASLFQTRWVRGQLLSKDSFYERLATHGHEVISDDDYASVYSPSQGRASIPPSVMIRALLLATHDRTSDRETSRRTRVDLDWKAALGVDDDFAGIAASTFSLMRARMLAADADAKLFEATLAKAVAAGIFKGPLTAIIDSSPVHGAGNVADTYELIRKMMGRLARAMGAHLDVDHAARIKALAATKADIDWQDPEARATQLAELVKDAAQLLGVLDESEVADDPEVLRAARDLCCGGAPRCGRKATTVAHSFETGWHRTGWSATPTPRCATGANRHLGALTATARCHGR